MPSIHDLAGQLDDVRKLLCDVQERASDADKKQLLARLSAELATAKEDFVAQFQQTAVEAQRRLTAATQKLAGQKARFAQLQETIANAQAEARKPPDVPAPSVAKPEPLIDGDYHLLLRRELLGRCRPAVAAPVQKDEGSVAQMDSAAWDSRSRASTRQQESEKTASPTEPEKEPWEEGMSEFSEE